MNSTQKEQRLEIQTPKEPYQFIAKDEQTQDIKSDAFWIKVHLRDVIGFLGKNKHHFGISISFYREI